MSSPSPAPILSPCTGVCTLDAAGCCIGCRRSTEEIAAWPTLDPRERERIMDLVLPEREHRRDRR